MVNKVQSLQLLVSGTLITGHTASKNFDFHAASIFVRDNRLLSAENRGTHGNAMTAQNARPTVVQNPENLEDLF